MVKFPTLYKKTSTKAIQQWSILAVEQSGEASGTIIFTEYGQVDGKLQTTSEVISEGKNVGKKNETTSYTQAVKEAEARHKKQKKKGYVESIKAAQEDQLDDLIEGGIIPMLAHKFTEQSSKIKYPCYFQNKLDGIRMVAIVKDGKATLWSRTRKPITSLPHIIEEIERNAIGKSFILDGECYNHAYKSNFEKIVSLVRQEEPDEDHTEVQYHIYDMPSHDGPFIERLVNMEDFFKYAKDLKYLKQVETNVVTSEEEVTDAFVYAKEMGYEGIMLRNFSGLYVNKRSYDLLKVKEFQDDEFKIIGIQEGRGRLSGHVGAFICITPEGSQFLAKAKGATSNLKEYFENEHLWKDKLLTVQYQSLTGYGVPRFPVGLRIRKPE